MKEQYILWLGLRWLNQTVSACETLNKSAKSCNGTEVQLIDHDSVEEDLSLRTIFSSPWQVEEDKWKVKMARGGVLVSRNGYRGTLPCRALWDMSSTEVAAQMTYYSSAGNAWAYRRRRFSCVLQTFNFACPPCCFYPGSARAPRRAEACLPWPLQRRIRARRTV